MFEVRDYQNRYVELFVMMNIITGKHGVGTEV